MIIKRMQLGTWLIAIGTAISPTFGADFHEPAGWATFDASVNDPPAGLGGYMMPCTDGQYVYYPPSGETADRGKVLRFDASMAFDDPSAWSTFHPRANGIGEDPEGFVGCIYDTRFVYFIPYRDGSRYHAEVLQYDTQRAFGDVDAWTTHVPVGALGGYQGGAFDGRYLYLAPHRTSGVHHQVVRYDTLAPFHDDSSWALYEPLGAGGGYAGAAFDGRYVYFAPTATMGGNPNRVLRYDTTLGFDAPGAWETCDLPFSGGYVGVVVADAYVYFVPNDANFGQHGEVIRYVRTGGFCDAESWQAFDYGDVCEGCMDPDGYADGCYDGRYMYFAPLHNGTAIHAEVLRFDTTCPFDDALSWTLFDAQTNDPPGAIGGYFGAVCLNEAVYFSPFVGESGMHGEVLAFGTHECVAGPNLVCNGDFELGNTCFASEYDYTEDDLAPGTTYAITPDPDSLHWMDLCDYGDHTTGTGLMMAVNSAQGDDPPDLTVWAQTVPVEPAHGYTLSLWVSTWSYASPAHLHVLVNDSELADFDAPSVCGEWQQFAFNWYAGTATMAELRIYSDLNGGADFALDDISFHAICETDCNGNGVADAEDIADCSGASWCSDCNDNGIPDECDIADCAGASWCSDCDLDGVPDGCEVDCDGDGLIDDCDADIDNDGVLNEEDVCDFTPANALVEPDGGVLGDIDGDCDVDLVDFGLLQSRFTGPGCND